MFHLLHHIALLGLLSTAHAAACTRCPISITYTTPAGCPALNCNEPTCTVTTTTSIPTSYCATKTRTACVRSCAPCYTETITVEDDPIMVQPTIAPEPSTEQPTADPESTINPGGPIILPTSEPSPTNVPGQCAPYTVTTTATNPACTFDTSECIRPLCVFETTTTVPSCGEAVTQTEVAVCETECPAGCATFTYTATSGAEFVATPIATLD